jgi:hypothetical protein
MRDIHGPRATGNHIFRGPWDNSRERAPIDWGPWGGSGYVLRGPHDTRRLEIPDPHENGCPHCQEREE